MPREPVRHSVPAATTWAEVLAKGRLPKDEFIRAVGLVWFAASLPLVAGYLENGVLNGRTAQLSALVCLPAFAGLWLGQWLRGFIDQESFRKVLLLALFLIGLNLIRRALF